MAIFKCKMCSGTLEINNNETVVVCEYCGTQQTLPSANDEAITNLHNRANSLRLKCEFDKAEEIYNKILEKTPEDAEAHWGIILCKYGIEYVEDLKTYKRVPTCHRTSFEAVLADEDYKAALEYADGVQRGLYEAEAKEIDRIQKDILSVVKSEKPFDVFICYKETDNNGKRTQDSVIANDIYHQLTQIGFKVFYAAITLEDKVGREYEPYIFAALNSAKIMLVVGTKPEYFSAVWVKNEWSRFMKLMKTNHSKLLIPCYKEMDAYELPEEFAHLQAQDMGKIGFINDIVRGIKKVISVESEQTSSDSKQASDTVSGVGTASLLKRGYMFLEDKNWSNADDYFERALDIDPECAAAYLGKFMADTKIDTMSALIDINTPDTFENLNYKKALRYADDDLRGKLNQAETIVFEKYCAEKYRKAVEQKAKAEQDVQYFLENFVFGNADAVYNTAIKELEAAAEIFGKLESYKDSTALKDACLVLATECHEYSRKDEIYTDAQKKMNKDSIGGYTAAALLFDSISGWRDAEQQSFNCREYARIAQDVVDAIKQNRNDNALKAQKSKMQKLNDKIERLATIESSFPSVMDGTDALHRQEQEIIKKKELLESELKSLGLFAGKKKKQIREEMDALRMKSINIAEQRDRLHEKLAGYDTLIDVQKEKAGLQQEFDRLEAVINKYHIDSKLTCEQALDLWQRDTHIKKCAWKKLVNNSITHTIDQNRYFTFGLKSDGTVVATKSTGYYNAPTYDVGDWADIVAISAGKWGHILGLKSDGTVVAKSREASDRYIAVDDWTDIVAISAGSDHTVGLKFDGTVVAAGYEGCGQCNVDDWTDIVAVSAGEKYTVGLKFDGTVVAVGENEHGQCNVDDWTDIVAISTNYNHTVGLKFDGTVVAVGKNDADQCNVDDWTDIIAISAGSDHTVGLKSDGTVVATEYNGWYNNGQCDVDDWTDIVAISAGDSTTVGLKSDGTVVAVGLNNCGHCNVDDWTDIMLPE